MLINNTKHLAIFLKNSRMKANLTQKEVSELIGIKQATVSTIENNPGNSRINTLYKILSALDIELHLNPKPNNNTDIKDKESENW